jgi:hypothetical protein
MKNIKKSDIMRAVNTFGFRVQKRSPEILLAAGIIGGVVATVMACKATLKVESVSEEINETLDIIKEKMDNASLNESGKYTKEDGENDLNIMKVKSVLKYAKLYAPAVFVGSLSIAALLGSHNILSRRNVALAAAYVTIDKSFKEYRERVTNRFGADVENEIRYDIKSEKVDETTIDGKGKEKVVKKDVKVAGEPTGYAQYFETSLKNNDQIMMILNSEERYANDCLVSTGRVFLNDVYKRLGMKPSKPGQMVGWRYDTKNPTGDNVINFDIVKTTRRNKNGELEDAYLIDFNVDGNIWNEM